MEEVELKSDPETETEAEAEAEVDGFDRTRPLDLNSKAR